MLRNAGPPWTGTLDRLRRNSQSITRYVTFYNQRRPHRALSGATPDTAYFASRDLKVAA
jgi:transposase InsO family protein